MGYGKSMRWIATVVGVLTIAVLLPVASSGAAGWGTPEALPATVDLDPRSSDIHPLPEGDVSLTNVLPVAGSLVVYTEGPHLYALALDSDGAPGSRYEIAGVGDELTDVSLGYLFRKQWTLTNGTLTEDQAEADADAKENNNSNELPFKLVLSRIVFTWTDTAPDGSSRIMSGSLSVDGTVGPVVQRSDLALAPDVVADPSVAVGSEGELGFVWRQRVGPDWRIAMRIIDKDGNAKPIVFPSELIGDASDPGIASTTEGGFRVAWIQQTPQGKNIITAGYDADGQIKLYKPVPGEVPPNPKNPARPEWDYTRYELLQPTTHFGPGAIGDPSELHVWSMGDGSARMTWIRARTEDGQTRRVVEAATYVDGAMYWVDFRPTEKEPIPEPPIDHTLALARMTPMSRDVSELTINRPANGRSTWAYRGVQDGKNWIFGGLLQANGELSPRAFDQQDTAGPGSWPRAGLNARGATVLTWTGTSPLPAGTRAWAAYFPYRSAAVLSLPLADAAQRTTAQGGVVNQAGIPLALTELDDGANPVARVSRYFDPRADVVSSTVRFGRMPIGRSYASPVFVTNRGTSPSQVNGISFTANDGSFSLADPNACLGALAPGAVCETKVRFTPSSESAASATLSLSTSEGVRDVQITGRGMITKRLGLSLSKSSFKKRAGAKVGLRATVTNTGGAPVSGVRVCLTGGNRFVRPSRRCANLGTMAPGASVSRRLTVKVRNRARKGQRLLKVRLKGDGVLDRRRMVKVRVR